MEIRKGEPGLVNRHSYLDNIAMTAHQLESDIRFYEEEYADREILAREFFRQHQYKKAYVMYFDGASGTTTVHAVRPSSNSGRTMSSAPALPEGPVHVAADTLAAARIAIMSMSLAIASSRLMVQIISFMVAACNRYYAS